MQVKNVKKIQIQKLRVLSQKNIFFGKKTKSLFWTIQTHRKQQCTEKAKAMITQSLNWMRQLVDFDWDGVFSSKYLNIKRVMMS